MLVPSRTRIRVADEVWIATALLHRERPQESDFAIEEIVRRVGELALSSSLRPGVYVHVVQHCVANRPPNPGRYRMLFESAPGHRRLFRKGDSYHPDREGGKATPNPEEMPESYSRLLRWYQDWCAMKMNSVVLTDPLLGLLGSGSDLWSGEHADDYVRRLREDWK